MVKVITTTLFLCFFVLTPALAEPLEVGNYYFKATWCGPCASQSKIVAELQKQGYKFTIYDADADPDIFKEMGVTAIPMTIIVKDTVLKLKGKQSVKKLTKLLVKE